MLRTRIIPALLLRNQSLVKTLRFGKFSYVGDPCNTVRIFNELEVDELLFLDITASLEKRSPNFQLLTDIASECFMPMGYGGGIKSIEDAKAVFGTGFEKIVVNTYGIENPSFIDQLASEYGSQAVMASIDVKKNIWGQYQVRSHSGKQTTNQKPSHWAKELESLGAGEILLTSIDKEGSWQGFDLDLVKSVTEAVKIPVIAHGGAGTVGHIVDVVQKAGASAVALGSMVVFQKKDMGILINFPQKEHLEKILT